MTKIEQQVMAGVAVIHTARMLTSATAIRLYVLAVSFAGVAAFASVPNVVRNFETVAPGGPAGITFFIIYAVLGTTIVVQFALAVGAVAFVSLFVSGIRSFFARRALFA